MPGLTRIDYNRYIEDSYTLDEFLECFPSVTREMACRLLERSESALLAPASA